MLWAFSVFFVFFKNQKFLVNELEGKEQLSCAGHPKNFTQIFHREFPQNKALFGCEGKEDIGIPKIFDSFKN